MRNHFVPKMLLKQFSLNGIHVSMYNYDQRFYKDLVSVKEQCSKFGIYPDGIEEGFAKLETTFASHIKDAVNEKYRYGFKPYSPEWLANDFILYSFINYQYSRTNKAAEAFNSFREKALKIMNREKAAKQNIDLSKVSLIDKNAHFRMIADSVTTHIALFDLKIKILKNSTELDFITSDNPISPYNQFANFHPKCKGLVGSQIGLLQLGLQLFFPINPKYTIVLFDQRDYTIGKSNQDIVEIRTDEEVVAINKIIACHADKCIYFKDINKIGLSPEDYSRFKNENGNFQEDNLIEGEAQLRSDGKLEKKIYLEKGGVMKKIDLSFSVLNIDRKFQENLPLLEIRTPGLVAAMEEYEKFIKEKIQAQMKQSKKLI